jgi:ABC-type lipoprotein export system ATPase subunit
MSQNLNSGIDINDDFKACILEMEQSDTPCLFITGKAGTGKSTLLQHWRKTTQKKYRGFGSNWNCSPQC